MEDQHFSVSDLNFRPFETDTSSANAVKTEDVKDEDMLLFSQVELDQLADVTANNTTFQIIHDLELANHAGNPSFTLQQAFGDVHHVGSEIGDNEQFSNKMPIDLSGLCKVEGIKSENNVTHYVKYKLQEGKHVKIWECGICGKEFGHQYTLMRHLPTHTDERKFQCNTCGKAFRQMSTLSQHRAIHSSERPYVCEVCHKTFNRVSTLISHRKTHTGMKPHRCHLCNKAFHQKGNLRNHIFTHTNERPYKCDICNKGFNQMSNLMCHKMKAHQRADKPKYTCQICQKDFTKRVALRNHEQYQHGVNNQPMEIPNIPEAITRDPNAIIVEAIRTEAMRAALAANQIPFALLRPLTGIPVLVRVLPAGGDRQMLVPATAEDLKKHGHISITPKEGQPCPTGVNAEGIATVNGEGKMAGAAAGSTVQIRIPVVATVIQQGGQGGHFSMSVVSPGPSGQEVSGTRNTVTDNFVFTSPVMPPLEAHVGSLGDQQGEVQTVQDENLQNPLICGGLENSETATQVPTLTEPLIEYFDQNGSKISEEEFHGNNGLETGDVTIKSPDDAVIDYGRTELKTPPAEQQIEQQQSSVGSEQKPGDADVLDCNKLPFLVA